MIVDDGERGSLPLIISDRITAGDQVSRQTAARRLQDARERYLREVEKVSQCVNITRGKKSKKAVDCIRVEKNQKKQRKNGEKVSVEALRGILRAKLPQAPSMMMHLQPLRKSTPSQRKSYSHTSDIFSATANSLLSVEENVPDTKLPPLDIDMSNKKLLPGDVFMMMKVYGTNPGVSSVNLNNNTLATGVEYKLLLNLLQNPSITNIKLSGTGMSHERQEALLQTAAENRARKNASEREASWQVEKAQFLEWQELQGVRRRHLISDEREIRISIKSQQARLWREINAAAIRSHTAKVKRQAAIEREKVFRAALAELLENEILARCDIQTKYFSFPINTLRLSEEFIRSFIHSEENKQRTHLRHNYLKSWDIARTLLKRRLELEKRERQAFEAKEHPKRMLIIDSCSISLQEVVREMYSHGRWLEQRLQEISRLRERQTLQRDEVLLAEIESFKHISDCRSNIEQLRIVALVREQRLFFSSEDAGRQEFVCCVQADFEYFLGVHAVFTKSVETLHLLLESRDRRHELLSTPPHFRMVDSQVGIQPPAFIVGQQSVSPIAISSKVSVTITMPDGWYEEILSNELLELEAFNSLEECQRMREEFVGGKTISGSPEVVDKTAKFFESISAMSSVTKGPPAKPGPMGEWPPAADIVNEHFKIVGGQVTCQVDDDVHHNCYISHPSRMQPEKDVVRLRKEQKFVCCETHTSKSILSNLHLPMSSHPRCRQHNSATVSVFDGYTSDAVQREVSEFRFYSNHSPTDRTLPMLKVIQLQVSLSLVLNFCNPSSELRHVTCSQAVGLPVVVMAPYIFTPGCCISTWQETEDVKITTQLFDGLVACEAPLITGCGRSASWDVTSGSGAYLTNYENSIITIQITEGGSQLDRILLRQSPSSVVVQNNLIIVKDKIFAIASEGDLGEGCASFTATLTENANASELLRFCERLRFHVPGTQAPLPGVRKIVVRIVCDKIGAVSEIHAAPRVVAVDDPAEFTLQKTALLYHSNEGPPGSQKYCHEYPLYIFGGSTLVDSDTEFFVGGSLRVVASNLQKFDTICVSESYFKREWELTGQELEIVPPSSESFKQPTIQQSPSPYGLEKEVSPPVIVTATDIPIVLPALSVQMEVDENNNEPREHVYELFTDQQSPRFEKDFNNIKIYHQGQLQSRHYYHRVFYDGVPLGCFILISDEQQEYPHQGFYKEAILSVSENGLVCIKGLEAFVRSFLFKNLAATPSTATTRIVDIEMSIGPTCTHENGKMVYDMDQSHTVLNGQVAIRVTPALITVSNKLSHLKYVEGSGLVRLAIFDVLHEQYCDVYDGGFLRVEIVEGYTKGEDFLTLREDGITLNLREEEQREVGDNSSRWKSLRKSLVIDSVNQPEADSSSLGNTLGAFVAQPALNRNLLDVVSNLQCHRTKKKPTTSYDVTLDGKHVAIMTFYPEGGFLQINFGKGNHIKRRDIIILLRNVGFRNVSDAAQHLSKTVVVVLNSGSDTSTRCFVSIAIQTVDDVTEILIRNPRVKYRPSPLPFVLLPIHTALAYDSDTQFFDGGYLIVEIIGGSTKNDFLTLLTPEEQEVQIELGKVLESIPAKKGVINFALKHPSRHIFKFNRKMITFQSGEQFPYSYSFGKSGPLLKINFPKNKTSNDVVTETGLVNIDRVSYLMNMVTYSCSESKLKEGTRTVQIRICDGSNPIEGKGKMSVEVKGVLITPSLPPKVVFSRRTVVNPLAKLSIGAFFADTWTGKLSVRLPDKDVSEVLSVPKEIKLESGLLLLGAGVPAGVFTLENGLISIEATSSRATQKQLTQFIRTIQLRSDSQQPKNTILTLTVTDSTTVSVAEIPLAIK